MTWTCFTVCPRFCSSWITSSSLSSSRGSSTRYFGQTSYWSLVRKSPSLKCSDTGVSLFCARDLDEAGGVGVVSARGRLAAALEGPAAEVVEADLLALLLGERLQGDEPQVVELAPGLVDLHRDPVDARPRRGPRPAAPGHDGPRRLLLEERPDLRDRPRPPGRPRAGGTPPSPCRSRPAAASGTRARPRRGRPCPWPAGRGAAR